MTVMLGCTLGYLVKAAARGDCFVYHDGVGGHQRHQKAGHVVGINRAMERFHRLCNVAISHKGHWASARTQRIAEGMQGGLQIVGM
jgi:hypothetical protein